MTVVGMVVPTELTVRRNQNKISSRNCLSIFLRIQSGYVSSSPFEQCRIPSHKRVLSRHFPSKHVYSSFAQLAAQLYSSVPSIQSSIPSQTRRESIH